MHSIYALILAIPQAISISIIGVTFGVALRNIYRDSKVESLHGVLIVSITIFLLLASMASLIVQYLADTVFDEEYQVTVFGLALLAGMVISHVINSMSSNE